MKIEIHLDHRYLNETLPLMNTTAENIVVWIYEKMAEALLRRHHNIKGQEWNLFACLKRRQAMQKQDGSGWKLSKFPLWKYLARRFKEKGWSLAKKRCLSEQLAVIIPVPGVIQLLHGTVVAKSKLSR